MNDWRSQYGQAHAALMGEHLPFAGKSLRQLRGREGALIVSWQRPASRLTRGRTAVGACLTAQPARRTTGTNADSLTIVRWLESGDYIGRLDPHPARGAKRAG